MGYNGKIGENRKDKMIYKTDYPCPVCNTQMVEYEPPGDPRLSLLKVRCRKCRKVFVVCGDAWGQKFVDIKRVQLTGKYK